MQQGVIPVVNPGGENTARGLIEKLLSGKSLIIASNRGPYEFRVDDDTGEVRPFPGGGGLVSALDSALEGTQAIWVASAMTPEDEQVALASRGRAIGIPPENPRYRLRMIRVGERTYHQYYNVVSNLLLWFMQHYLWDIPAWPDIDEGTHRAWARGYREVNRMFADAIVRTARSAEGRPVILIQDYHLSLCARYVREKAPDALIEHFTHTPWCQPDYMRLLSPYMRDEIIESMLSCDVVSFHTSRYAQNFLWCCKEFTEYPVDLKKRRVQTMNGHVLVRHHPISVDCRGLEEMKEDPQILKYREEFKRMLGGRKMVLRVDRVELSKNIVRGFKIYREFLERYQKWWGRVVFVVLIYPSRLGLPQYRRYLDEVKVHAEELNNDFSTKHWEPVILHVEDNRPRSAAGMCESDVLIVNPLFDGMNLVSKEGAVLNCRDGVVVLSENAGSFEELGEHVIPVSPLDIQAGAAAINEALSMSDSEKSKRAAALKSAVESNTSKDWLLGQLKDMP